MGRKAIPQDPIFAAEMAALEAERHEAWQAKHAAFSEAWAARLERDTPQPDRSELHVHAEACFDGTTATAWLPGGLGWYEGRWCLATRAFIPETRLRASPNTGGTP